MDRLFSSDAPRVEPLLMSDIEAGLFLGVSARTIANLRKGDGLPSVKLRGRRLFHRDALRRYAESLNTVTK
jgi:excisionase family DNA binding protein